MAVAITSESLDVESRTTATATELSTRTDHLPESTRQRPSTAPVLPTQGVALIKRVAVDAPLVIFP